MNSIDLPWIVHMRHEREDLNVLFVQQAVAAWFSAPAGILKKMLKRHAIERRAALLQTQDRPWSDLSAQSPLPSSSVSGAE